MKAFHEYWSFSAIRGIMALFAAIAIVAIPRAAADLFSIPVLLLLAVALYALYNFFDAAAMILLAAVLPFKANKRRAFVVQSALAFVFGILLLLVGYRVLSISWLFGIAMLQAATSAVTEFLVARGTHRVYGCLSCYSTAIVLACAALALPFAVVLDPVNQALALAAYLTLFGFSEWLTGGRMLFLDYRAEHPMPQWLSTTWHESMTIAPAPTPALPLEMTELQLSACEPTSCAACPAEAVCRDNSFEAQLALLLASRQPSIVNTVRAASLMHAHR
jgi:hypothetical protein